jgi:hypothetical protein
VHFELTREDLADWSSPTDPVTPAEFWDLDQKTFKSINGEEGGVWAPSSAIVIGGQGLQVTGTFLATGYVEIGDSAVDELVVISTVDLQNDVTIGGDDTDTLAVNSTTNFDADVTIGLNGSHDLQVEATAFFDAGVTFDSTVQFNGDVTFGVDDTTLVTVNSEALFLAPVTLDFPVDITSSLVVTGNATLGNGPGDDLTVEATAVFEAEVGFNNTATFGGDAVFTGAVVCSPGSSLTINEPLQFTTDGRVPWRVFEPPDSNATITPAQGNAIYVHSLTATRNYTLDVDTAVEGDFFIFFSPVGGAGGIWVTTPEGAGQQVDHASGAHRWSLYVFADGEYQLALTNGTPS